MRRFWLKLTDPRLKAAARAVEGAGAALGDLESSPAGTAAFFKPVRERLAGAARTDGSNPGATAVIFAAEDFILRLEKVFTDMSLHSAAPDAAVKEALVHLQGACAATADLLATSGKDGAAARAAAFCAGGRRILRLAKAASDSDEAGFPGNLKFSSIYSGLDAVFDALERYAQALYET